MNGWPSKSINPLEQRGHCKDQNEKAFLPEPGQLHTVWSYEASKTFSWKGIINTYRKQRSGWMGGGINRAKGKTASLDTRWRRQHASILCWSKSVRCHARTK